MESGEELAAFLLARLDEDQVELEADAPHHTWCDAVSLADPGAAGPCDCGVPARLRREIEAKRAIVASLERDLQQGARTDLTRGGRIALVVTCRRLAGVYGEQSATAEPPAPQG